ncbi:aquaporin-11 isoform X1 [Emydura macquarii macquarii]|uniref:aquaporin-11 isoform X1 n=1 Tax=Emydura macquarii macquarii TaxID=1129001 RepID=UPI00352ABB07
MLGEVLAPLSQGLLTMVLDETWISLLLMAGTMISVGGCRKLTRRHVHLRRPRPRTFLLEMLSTFQICACTNELRLLANVQPKPHVALTLTYIFTVLHGLTLPGSTCNPCGTLQHILDGGISVKQGGLKIAAQFFGAMLARIYMHHIWSLGITKVHSEALAQGCSEPIQTTETQAFCIELLFSAVFQLTILQFESVKPRLRVHLVALLITMLVYGAAAIAAFRVFCSTPMKHLSQIRRKEKRIRDDLFQEILQASAALENKNRAWSITIADSLEKDSVERRKVLEKGRHAAGCACASQAANRDAADSGGPGGSTIPCLPPSASH